MTDEKKEKTENSNNNGAKNTKNTHNKESHSLKKENIPATKPDASVIVHEKDSRKETVIEDATFTTSSKNSDKTSEENINNNISSQTKTELSTIKIAKYTGGFFIAFVLIGSGVYWWINEDKINPYFNNLFSKNLINETVSNNLKETTSHDKEVLDLTALDDDYDSEKKDIIEDENKAEIQPPVTDNEDTHFSITENNEDINTQIDKISNEANITEKTEELKSEIEDLKAAISDLKEKNSELKEERDKYSPKTFITFTSLENKVMNGMPYQEQLNDLAGYFDVKSFKTLNEYAAAGLPSRQKIIEMGLAYTDEAFKAISSVDSDNNSIGDSVVKSLQNLVVVKPAEPLEGDSAVAILSRVEDALKNSDLEAALYEAETLSPKAETLLKEWVKKANTHLDALNELTELQKMLIEE